MEEGEAKRPALRKVSLARQVCFFLLLVPFRASRRRLRILCWPPLLLDVSAGGLWLVCGGCPGSMARRARCKLVASLTRRPVTSIQHLQHTPRSTTSKTLLLPLYYRQAELALTDSLGRIRRRGKGMMGLLSILINKINPAVHGA